MKKLISIFAMLLLIGSISAQTALTATKTFKTPNCYLSYVGDASDTIKRVADSTSIEFINEDSREFKLSLITKFSKVTNADTTVQVTLWGKNSANESYTMIAGYTTANVTTSAYVYSINYATALRWRYIKASYRLRATPKSAGVKITQIECRIWNP